jgi:hypothetical protein
MGFLNSPIEKYISIWLPVDNATRTLSFAPHWCTSASEYWQMNDGSIKMSQHREFTVGPYRQQTFE